MNLNFIFGFLIFMAFSISVRDPWTGLWTSPDFGPVHDSWVKRNLLQWKIIKIESYKIITSRTDEWECKIHWVVSKTSSRTEKIFQNLGKNFKDNIKIMLQEFVIAYEYWLRTKSGFQIDSWTRLSDWWSAQPISVHLKPRSANFNIMNYCRNVWKWSNSIFWIFFLYPK